MTAVDFIAAALSLNVLSTVDLVRTPPFVALIPSTPPPWR